MDRKDIELLVQQEFVVGVKEVFNDNLTFAFICGGFAKGYWDKNHDIDMFICVDSPIDQYWAKKYLKWHLDLHKKYGFPADEDYPGEIVVKDQLANSLKKLPKLKLQLRVDDLSVKEAIIWADMLVGEKAALIGNNLEYYRQLESEYCMYPEKWKKEVLALISDKEKEEWEDKSYLLIMERFMQYPHNDAREFYKKYSL